MAIHVLKDSSLKKVFGVFNTSNELLEVFYASNEDYVWTYFLGWPSQEEIVAAKQQGLQVRKLKVFWSTN